jgi:hypothetical protein
LPFPEKESVLKQHGTEARCSKWAKDEFTGIPIAAFRQLHIRLHSASDDLNKPSLALFAVSGLPGANHIYGMEDPHE